MRTISSTLLAAQRATTRTPYVKLEAKNRVAGVVRLDWQRLYSGSEDDYFHAVTIPGDGSLIRVRITPPADSRKLYRQRVAGPGPSSDFSQWTYTSQYSAVAVATASLGGEVSIFWINTSRELRRIKSTDYGVSWGSPELIDYSPTTAVYGLAAAYKPNGDLAVFFADQATLFVKKRVGGSWQTKAAWDKTTGNLSSVATVYDSDWDLFVTGKDSSGNFKLWSLVYGDGGDVPSGTWSGLKEFASAPSGGSFEYGGAFMDKPDVARCFFVERYTGIEAYNRPFRSYSVPDSRFSDNLWREPVPFNLSSQYGLATAHFGDYVWLSSPGGVWRSSKAEQSLDLSGDILSLRQEAGVTGGVLAVELRNDAGQYASPGEGSLSVLDIGCQMDFSPGYRTTASNEVSAGQTFILDAGEHATSGGKASLILHALDAWCLIKNWTARHQFRWNKSANEMSVKQILQFVLGRAGLKLEVASESAAITGYYPDFTIPPGTGGDTVVSKLLSFVPDMLFIEGSSGVLVYPQSSDSPVYSYGVSHAILEGRYREKAWGLNHIQVEGRNPANGQPIIVDSFSWTQLDRHNDRLSHIEDSNIDSVDRAQQRGESLLRKSEIASSAGNLRIPVNCGQQLYDVIDITDGNAGLNAEKRRVLGLTLNYNPRRGESDEILSLGAI
jgi:hypothetical protein